MKLKGVNKPKKQRMWIACCGCGIPYSLADNVVEGPDSLSTLQKIMYITACPECGFKHKVEVTSVVQ